MNQATGDVRFAVAITGKYGVSPFNAQLNENNDGSWQLQTTPPMNTSFLDLLVRTSDGSLTEQITCYSTSSKM